MRPTFLTVVAILLLSGCSQLAMSYAHKGDYKAMESAMETGGLTKEEKDPIRTEYCATMEAKSSRPEYIFITADCHLSCVSTRYCDKVQGVKLLVLSARYGYGPAQVRLTKMGAPLPAADLSASYVAQQNRDSQERQAILLSDTSSDSRRTCTYTRTAFDTVEEDCR